jgi:hypothetical protein
MKHRTPGRPGLMVSEVALVSMQFGRKMNIGNLGRPGVTRPCVCHARAGATHRLVFSGREPEMGQSAHVGWSQSEVDSADSRICRRFEDRPRFARRAHLDILNCSRAEARSRARRPWEHAPGWGAVGPSRDPCCRAACTNTRFRFSINRKRGLVGLVPLPVEIKFIHDARRDSLMLLP